MTIDRLTELADALEKEEDGAVLERFWAVEDVVETDRRMEERFDRLATAIRHVSDPDRDAFRRSGAYVETAVNLDTVRDELSLATFEYLAADGSAAYAQEQVQAAITAYETIEQRREALESISADAAVPAVLAFDGVDDNTASVGNDLTVEVPLSNVGSSAAMGIELHVSDTFESSIEPTEIDSLDAGAATAVRVAVAPDRADSAVVTVTASTENAGDDVSFAVNALDRRGFISRARRKSRNMINIFEINRPGRMGGPSIQRQLTRVEQKLESAADAVDRGAPSGRVDGKLNAAGNTLKSVRNRLENAETGLDPIVTVELEEELTSTIETVKHAIDAE